MNAIYNVVHPEHAAYVAGVVVFLFIARCFYNVYFHPLSSFPGPTLWAATNFASIYHHLRGRGPMVIKELHEKYGFVVRTGPSTLSFNNDQGWEDIYGHVKGTHTKTFSKDPAFYGPTVSGAPNIIMANDEQHRRLRKLTSHAFSEKALVTQESYLQKYVRTFIRGLYREVEGPKKGLVSISMWYNFTTFDLIGDLAFAAPFGCTESGALHPWIEMTFDAVKVMEFFRIARLFPAFELTLNYFIPKKLVDLRLSHARFSAEKAQRRVNMKTDRKDFMSYLLKDYGTEDGLTPDEINEASSILVLAGSETTATVLIGLTYHMLKRPETYQKLKEEIRSSFNSEEEMTVTVLGGLKYLNACLEEGLRIYPPAPSMHPRIAPRDGGIVCGLFIPEGTRLGVGAYAANRSSLNFKKPDEFRPERYLGDPEFSSDHPKASQPFSYGPRNCIGRSLAWAEMRLLVANLLWNFDLELSEEDQDWEARNKIFILWEKPELHVRLIPRVQR